MDWFNLHIPTMGRSPEYVGSSPTERGTWLSVMLYACQIECGGRIDGAASWKDRQWQQAAGVTLDEVKAASRLLRFDGGDLIVNGYPAECEKQVRRNRKSAKAGGMARWSKTDADRNAENMPPGIATPMPPGIGENMPTGNAKGEGEGEGEHESARATPSHSIPTEPPTGTDADLWRYRTGAEPWARTLKRAGCKIGPNNWRAWQGLIERAFNGQADTCAAAAAKVKPEDRWPDQVEAAARTEAPSAIASKYADRQARIKTVQVTP